MPCYDCHSIKVTLLYLLALLPFRLLLPLLSYYVHLPNSLLPFHSLYSSHSSIFQSEHYRTHPLHFHTGTTAQPKTFSNSNMPETSNNRPAQASPVRSDIARPAKRARTEAARIPAKFKEGDWALTQALMADGGGNSQGVPVKITKAEFYAEEGKWYYFGKVKGLGGHEFEIHCVEESLVQPALAIRDRVEEVDDEDEENIEYGTVTGYKRTKSNKPAFIIEWDSSNV